MQIDIIETSAGFNKMVDFVLLVRTDFQTYMGDAGIMKDRDQVSYELENRFSFMPSSEHYKVM